ncbi:hypothetical protein SS50377_26294 [Spironucleus salmonicida]|uniref:Uncharacterized protein n=1 Tax=Spironucleus salmonicida TaxID=348837 RepID=A0A9P8LPV6_9EUKA|nr:hypothetical protein SS50377_26285 [Spironucleus salmonicida]KAH0572087.1 hypothetical protein SS50377_26294 [Spironucleus salmonicida]
MNLSLNQCNNLFRKRLSELKEQNTDEIKQVKQNSIPEVGLSELTLLRQKILTLELDKVDLLAQKQHLMTKCEEYIDQILDFREQLILLQTFNRDLQLENCEIRKQADLK